MRNLNKHNNLIQRQSQEIKAGEYRGKLFTAGAKQVGRQMTKPIPDIVKRLRLIKGRWLGLNWWRPTILEAADEIARLRAELKAFEARFDRLKKSTDAGYPQSYRRMSHDTNTGTD